MKHSTPILLFVFIPMISVILIFSIFMLGFFGGIFEYLICGLLIWIIGHGDIDFAKTLVFWWPAIVFDKPEWLNA